MFQIESHRTGKQDRQIWIECLCGIIDPVLENMDFKSHQGFEH